MYKQYYLQLLGESNIKGYMDYNEATRVFYDCAIIGYYFFNSNENS